MKQKLLAGLIKLRKERNYGQKYMASQLGIQQSMYSRLETGKEEITLTRLEKILNILDTDIATLVAISGEVVLEKELEKVLAEHKSIEESLEKILKKMESK